MTLADFIVPGSSLLRLHFPAEDESVEYGEVWKAGQAVGRLRAASDGAPVAIALANTRACASVVVGAVGAGLPLLSVPLPPRGVDVEWYAAFIERICARAGASTFVLDGSLLQLIPPLDGITFRSFEDVLALRGPSVAEPSSFVLTQFTSGSTADPKGVVLSGDKIVANLDALLGWIQPAAGDGVCTWLPLSHDMGLIGTFLCALAGLGDAWARGGDLVVMTPQGFLRNPGSWLATCESFGSTLTAAPNYGYEMAARRRGERKDLRRLRICIAGGEPIRASALDRFARTFADDGFDPTALCPAYGMAEAALAVTATPSEAHWRTTDPKPLVAQLDLMTGVERGAPVVSSGRPLPGYDVRIAGERAGEILVQGPSLASSYADGSSVVDDDGWFHTRDLGFLDDGELYVLGRTDDVFQVAGRNVYALDVELYASEIDGVRPGRVVAVAEDGALTLVAECEPAFADRAAAGRLARALTEQIFTRLGVAPRRVLLTARGALPMTSSGKIRRRPLLAALEARQLEVLPGSIE